MFSSEPCSGGQQILASHPLSILFLQTSLQEDGHDKSCTSALGTLDGYPDGVPSSWAWSASWSLGQAALGGNVVCSHPRAEGTKTREDPREDEADH